MDSIELAAEPPQIQNTRICDLGLTIEGSAVEELVQHLLLRELARSYLTLVKDLTRVMNRLKAMYRGRAIPCAGRDVYYARHRAEWLSKIPEAGVRRRAERLYQQLDMLQHLRQQARRELLGGAERRPALQEAVVARMGTRTAGIPVSPVGVPAPARSTGVAGSTDSYDCRADPSHRAGSGEVSGGAAVAFSIYSIRQDRSSELKISAVVELYFFLGDWCCLQLAARSTHYPLRLLPKREVPQGAEYGDHSRHSTAGAIPYRPTIIII